MAKDGAASPEREREFHFTKADFDFVREAVYEHAGIKLAENKTDMVYSRLGRRLRTLSLTSFSEYREYLATHDEELTQFINALTTNLTHFFRENHHFDYLAKTIIPEILKRHQSDRRVRIWSAGCSTGEEPYSIAITLLENLPSLVGWDIKILATDLDTQVLAKGSAGIYNAERVKDIPAARLKRWFRVNAQGESRDYKVLDDLRSLITFKQLNLIGEWPMSGPFDVIFCRNVVIYFDKPTQAKLFGRIEQMLDDDGVLMLGHSESLGANQKQFRAVGRTIFRKALAADAGSR